MTTASKSVLLSALEAYRKMDADEREVFHFVIEQQQQPAAKRGRPPRTKPAPETA